MPTIACNTGLALPEASVHYIQCLSTCSSTRTHELLSKVHLCASTVDNWASVDSRWATLSVRKELPGRLLWGSSPRPQGCTPAASMRVVVWHGHRKKLSAPLPTPAPSTKHMFLGLTCPPAVMSHTPSTLLHWPNSTVLHSVPTHPASFQRLPMQHGKFLVLYNRHKRDFMKAPLTKDIGHRSHIGTTAGADRGRRSFMSLKAGKSRTIPPCQHSQLFGWNGAALILAAMQRPATPMLLTSLIPGLGFGFRRDFKEFALSRSINLLSSNVFLESQPCLWLPHCQDHFASAPEATQTAGQVTWGNSEAKLSRVGPWQGVPFVLTNLERWGSAWQHEAASAGAPQVKSSPQGLSFASLSTHEEGHDSTIFTWQFLTMSTLQTFNLNISYRSILIFLIHLDT